VRVVRSKSVCKRIVNSNYAVLINFRRQPLNLRVLQELRRLICVIFWRHRTEIRTVIIEMPIKRVCNSPSFRCLYVRRAKATDFRSRKYYPAFNVPTASARRHGGLPCGEKQGQPWITEPVVPKIERQSIRVINDR